MITSTHAIVYVTFVLLAIVCCVLEFTCYKITRRVVVIVSMLFFLNALIGIQADGTTVAFEYKYCLRLIKENLKKDDASSVIHAIETYEKEFQSGLSHYASVWILRKQLNENSLPPNWTKEHEKYNDTFGKH